MAFGYDYELERLERRAPVEYAITVRYLQRFIAEGATAADVGVGVGHYSELLARRGCMLHLVDVSARLLDTAVARLRAAGLAERIASVHRASATDLACLPDGCCDAALLLGPLYHLGAPEERRRAVDGAGRRRPLSVHRPSLRSSALISLAGYPGCRPWSRSAAHYDR